MNYVDIKNEDNWIIRDMLDVKLVFTTDGLFENCKLVGSLCMVNKKVYRPSQFVVIGNWFDFLNYYKFNKQKVDSVVKEFYINLDDGNCCADGIIVVKNKNEVQTSVMVAFSCYAHDLIRKHLG